MADLFSGALIGCAVAMGATWVLSRLTREYSWVDRAWSLAPPAYVLWFTTASGGSDARLWIMAALSCAWGARLTYNFARKGGYRRGGEDYRWQELQKRMPPALFAIFNVVFICGFQHALLFLLAAPAWVALGGAVLGPLDALAAALFVLALAGQAIADQQQWRFQCEKKRGLHPRGFLDSGLFRFSRHPNYFCEQLLWCAFYLFGVAASGRWLQGWLAGPLLLIALFQGSTSFTERLTAAKYPAYADYQRRVARQFPWWPG